MQLNLICYTFDTMRKYIAVCINFYFVLQVNAQYNDTLFYKSGLEKACEIIKYDFDWIDYSAINSKKDTVYSSARINQLKYFVIYDSLNNKSFSSREVDPAQLQPKQDSIRVSPNLLSVNPFSIPLLGLNLQYVYRFGKNLQWGIHLPLRIISPIIWEIFLVQVGAGIYFFPVTNEKFSLTLGFTPSFVFYDSESIISFPVTMGFVRYLTNRFALLGNIGIGPAIGGPIVFPTAHLGFCFQLGEKRIINIQKGSY